MNISRFDFSRIKFRCPFLCPIYIKEDKDEDESGSDADSDFKQDQTDSKRQTIDLSEETIRLLGNELKKMSSIHPTEENGIRHRNPSVDDMEVIYP